MDLTKIGSEDVNWIDLAQDKVHRLSLVNELM
jgi:hypothetical protein